MPDLFPGDAEAAHASDRSAQSGREFDFAHEAQRFRDHHAAKGSMMADWPAAWRTWVGNAIRFADERQLRSMAPQSRSQPRAWTAIDQSLAHLAAEEPAE